MFSYLHVLQNYKHINVQFAGIASYKLQNYNLSCTHDQVCKFASACLQVHKFTSMQNYQITKLPITKYKITKLQVYKLHH
jgi:hypothetical protein